MVIGSDRREKTFLVHNIYINLGGNLHGDYTWAWAYHRTRLVEWIILTAEKEVIKEEKWIAYLDTCSCELLCIYKMVWYGGMNGGGGGWMVNWVWTGSLSLEFALDSLPLTVDNNNSWDLCASGGCGWDGE